jgi:hypothetical protein
MEWQEVIPATTEDFEQISDASRGAKDVDYARSLIPFSMKRITII